MYNVSVTLNKTDTPLPSGVTFDHTTLTVADSAGTTQSFNLNGSEATPWTQAVSGLADGTSTYVAQDVDSTGAPIGSVQTASYTPAVVVVMFPATSGITVSPA